jgi:hypothetical protein
MSILKVKKETTKLINREAALTEKEFSPGEIFIITDSKGKYIDFCVYCQNMFCLLVWIGRCIYIFQIFQSAHMFQTRCIQ